MRFNISFLLLFFVTFTSSASCEVYNLLFNPAQKVAECRKVPVHWTIGENAKSFTDAWCAQEKQIGCTGQVYRKTQAGIGQVLEILPSHYLFFESVEGCQKYFELNAAFRSQGYSLSKLGNVVESPPSVIQCSKLAEVIKKLSFHDSSISSFKASKLWQEAVAKILKPTPKQAEDLLKYFRDNTVAAFAKESTEEKDQAEKLWTELKRLTKCTE